MALFEYRAKTKEGENRSGTIETSSQEAALDALQRNNLIVLSIREAKPRSAFELKLPFFGGNGIRQKDVVIFSRQLATLFEARIPMVQSLQTLIGESQRVGLRTVITQILDDVSGGMSLSQALAKHPQVFSAFYVNLVRSGEESGKLEDVFKYLADYLERSYYLASKAKNAMMYPAFVLVAFVGVIVVMLVVVIPKLVSIFQDTGQAIPFYTQIVIYLSLFLRQWGLALILLLFAGIIFLWRWGMSSAGRLFFHRLQIHAPLVGDLYQKLYMARLTDNLQTLIAGGIPILRALSISGDVVGNVIYQKAITDAIDSVKAGSTISAAFERVPEIPVLVTQMIRIGETSGKLDFILANITKFYQREVDSLVENLVSLIEPALIIFLGAGVGVLVASVMIPLYSLVGSI